MAGVAHTGPHRQYLPVSSRPALTPSLPLPPCLAVTVTTESPALTSSSTGEPPVAGPAQPLRPCHVPSPCPGPAITAATASLCRPHLRSTTARTSRRWTRVRRRGGGRGGHDDLTGIALSGPFCYHRHHVPNLPLLFRGRASVASPAHAAVSVSVSRLRCPLLWSTATRTSRRRTRVRRRRRGREGHNALTGTRSGPHPCFRPHTSSCPPSSSLETTLFLANCLENNKE